MKYLLFKIVFISFCSGIVFLPVGRILKSSFHASIAESLWVDTCQGFVDEINYVPENSLVVIGHAYGSSGKSDLIDDIYPMDIAVYNFFEENKPSIDKVIFTGDVLYSPSLKQWENLFSFFHSRDIAVDIAPGNHDVGSSDDNALRDVFFQAVLAFMDISELSYPYHFLHKGQWFVVDHSSRPGSLDQLMDFLFKNRHLYKDHDLFVLRHHIASRPMASLSNSSSNPDVLISQQQQSFLSRSLAVNALTFIYGDTGAFHVLPRLACQQQDGILEVANGIGGLEGDQILLIADGQVFSHNLHNYRK